MYSQTWRLFLFNLAIMNEISPESQPEGIKISFRNRLLHAQMKPFNDETQQPDKPVPVDEPLVSVVPQKQFYSQYMDSPIYQQRLSNFGITDKPNIKNVVNARMIEKNGPGSSALNVELSNDVDSKKAGFPVVKGKSNINIDRSQVPAINKQYGVDAKLSDILAHEISHISRDLTPKEEEFIASKNKIRAESNLFKEFKKQGEIYDSKTLKPLGFSDYINTMYTPSQMGHDASPREIKADLDALRYILWKKGIYDTSKRDMTLDDLKKAVNDNDIKNSVEYKRLKDRFSAKDIIDLNNTIASISHPDTGLYNA